MRATHKKHTAIIGSQGVLLNPGQFLFGRKRASNDTGLSEQTIRTAIKMLKNNHQIDVKPTNKYSIITIINWDLYQPEPTKANQQTTIKVTNKQPTDNQQITTYKNIYNIKDNNTSPADADLLRKIDAISETLYNQGRFKKVHAFKNKMLKKNSNALYHALNQLMKAPKIPDDSAWSYCFKIMQVENGNYNEQEFQQRVEKQKRDLEMWVERGGVQ
jgi:hypothetical protein